MLWKASHTSMAMDELISNCCTWVPALEECVNDPLKVEQVWGTLTVQDKLALLYGLEDVRVRVYKREDGQMPCVFRVGDKGLPVVLRLVLRRDGCFEVLDRKPWAVGTVLEAEMADPAFPCYRDTIHPVRVLEVLRDGAAYRCKLLAFDGKEAEDVWNAEQLHEPREGGQVGDADNIHVRVRGREEDQKAKKKGIWVKGRVVKRTEREFEVEHTDWKEGVKRIKVGTQDVRPGYE